MYQNEKLEKYHYFQKSSYSYNLLVLYSWSPTRPYSTGTSIGHTASCQVCNKWAIQYVRKQIKYNLCDVEGMVLKQLVFFVTYYNLTSTILVLNWLPNVWKDGWNNKCRKLKIINLTGFCILSLIFDCVKYIMLTCLLAKAQLCTKDF